MKNKFKPGDHAYIDIKGDIRGPYTIKSIRETMVMPMVSFQETGSLSVGLCYVKAHPDDELGRMSDYLKRDNYYHQNIVEEGMNLQNRSLTQMEGVRNYAGRPELMFFRPNDEMIQWIVKYAADRLIIDVGCGVGRITERMQDLGAKVCGIDPYMDEDHIMHLNESRIRSGKSHIHFLKRKIEDLPGLFVGRGDKVLLLFARPCHSDFVYNAAQMKDKDTELLYITVPKNIEKYNDLLEFQEQANQIFPSGRSADNEIFYSLK